MECRFVCGQKVQCVHTAPLFARFTICLDMEWPEVGQVYTVRALTPDPAGVYAALVLLEEIRNNPCACAKQTEELGFPHVFFRALEPAGMEILRKIAENPPPLPDDDSGEPVKKRELETV